MFKFCSLYLSYYLLFSNHFLDVHLTQGMPLLASHNLVVAHHSEDISWLKHVRGDVVKTVYVLTSGEEECKDLISPVRMSVTKAGNKMELNQPELVCESIPNYGCEAGAYLSYLSRHYENLGDHNLFYMLIEMLGIINYGSIRRKADGRLCVQKRSFVIITGT